MKIYGLYCLHFPSMLLSTTAFRKPNTEKKLFCEKVGEESCSIPNGRFLIFKFLTIHFDFNRLCFWENYMQTHVQFLTHNIILYDLGTWDKQTHHTYTRTRRNLQPLMFEKWTVLTQKYRSFLVMCRKWSTGCPTCRWCQHWPSSSSLPSDRAPFHGWLQPNFSRKDHAQQQWRLQS